MNVIKAHNENNTIVNIQCLLCKCIYRFVKSSRILMKAMLNYLTHDHHHCLEQCKVQGIQLKREETHQSHTPDVFPL